MKLINLNKIALEWETTVDQLIKDLVETYTRPEIPPCRICGDELSVQSIGGGQPTKWACSADDNNGNRKPGRTSVIDQHYSDSYYIQYKHGDSRVIALINDFNELRFKMEGLEK